MGGSLINFSGLYFEPRPLGRTLLTTRFPVKGGQSEQAWCTVRRACVALHRVVRGEIRYPYVPSDHKRNSVQSFRVKKQEQPAREMQ